MAKCAQADTAVSASDQGRESSIALALGGKHTPAVGNRGPHRKNPAHESTGPFHSEAHIELGSPCAGS